MCTQLWLSAANSCNTVTAGEFDLFSINNPFADKRNRHFGRERFLNLCCN